MVEKAMPRTPEKPRFRGVKLREPEGNGDTKPGPRRSFPSAGLWRAFVLVAGISVGLVAFGLYFSTLAPTMLYYDPDGMYDSLMLQVKAYVLSIPNPTGYPTYMMIAHLFTYLPLDGGVGYRVNLASAVFGAAAVAVIFFICRILSGRIAPALVGAFLFAIGRTFWSQAVITEVYTLNALFIALDLFALFLWSRTRRDGHLLLFAFLMGLSMTNHMTSALVLPAAALFIVLTNWRTLLAWRLLAKGAGLFALGLLPYLYLPIRAMMDPPLDEADPSTPGRFIELVTGSNFQGRMFAFEWYEIPERLSIYTEYLASQFNPLFLVVAALGAFYLSYRREMATLATLGFLYLGWLVYGIQYDIRDHFIYFIPTYLVLCLLIAVGFGAVLDMLTKVAENIKSFSYRFPKLHALLGGRASRVSGVASLFIVSVAMLALTLPGISKVYADSDMSENYHGMHIMDAVLEGTAPGSTVMQNGGVMYYSEYVTGERPDLEIVDPFPAGGWSRKSLHWVRGATEALNDGRRAYIIFPGDTAENNEQLFWEAGYELVEDESGVFYEVVLRERDPMERGL